jgi:nitrite reductase/ring-hydroxylating ferredoxin subunit
MTPLAPLTNTQIFNRPGVIAEGWYWVAPTAEVRRGKVKAFRLLGRDLAVYRGYDGTVVALDAYCAHMGAHLAEGRVEGNALRCFFHHWRYDADGRCSDIPCLAGKPPERIGVRSWPVAERYGLIWVWTGAQAPHPVPEVPELAGRAIDTMLANRFRKNCHPSVVLINAIDEQHFRSVHKLPGSILSMEPFALGVHNMEFRNSGRMPRTHRLGRLLSRCYRDALTYDMSYWYGSLGTVTFGPDFLHLHLMFALRQGDAGDTEGQTVVFTRRRRGPLGWLLSRAILLFTALAARYFAFGDTRVFQTIRFDFRNPIAADRSVIAFIRHLEQQPIADWSERSDCQPPAQAREIAPLRRAVAQGKD